MKQYVVPLQENGRMILPADLRQALRISKGDRIVLRAEGDRVELTTARHERRRAQEIFRRYVPAGTQIVDEFIAERRAEARREDEETQVGPKTPTGPDPSE
jgi:AbrB family looped-hinge helix DNA binding protein